MRWLLMLCGLLGTTFLAFDQHPSAGSLPGLESAPSVAAPPRSLSHASTPVMAGPALRVRATVDSGLWFEQLPEDPWHDGPPDVSTSTGNVRASTYPWSTDAPPWKVWRPGGDGDGTWTAWTGPRPEADAAIPRVHYDLAGMIPPYVRWLPALEGRTQEPAAAARPASWRASMTSHIQRRIAEAAHSHDGCFLALDTEQPVLIVRAPPHAHDAIADLLDAEDRALRSVRTLALERPGAERLHVRVAAWRSARCVRGDAMTYLMDYDIEVAQDSFVSDPILGVVEGGLGLAVRCWYEAGDERIDVTVSRSAGPVRFTPYTANVRPWGPFKIELPEAPVETWTQRLANPAAREHAVVLGGEVLGRLVIGPLVDPEPDAPRRWRSHHEPTPSEPPRVGPLRVRVQGGRHGLLGVGVIRDGSGPGDTTILLRRPAGEGEAPVEGRATLRLAWGGQLRAGQTIDATLTVGRRRVEERTVSASRPAADGSGRVDFELKLPTADLQVDTRLVALDTARQGEATFEVDLGLGREEIRVLLAPYFDVTRASASR